MPETTQDKRIAAVATSPLEPDVLLFRSMSGTEALSRPYDFELVLLSENPNLAAADLLGHPLAISLIQADETSRYFHGHIARFGYAGVEGRYFRYQVRLRPWLWLLSRASNLRVFQQKNVPDIVKAVFDAHGFTDYRFALSETHPVREYCVQHRETDLEFVSRLLEEEGINYFFEHTAQKHTVVLADANDGHPTLTGGSELAFAPEAGNRRARDVYVYQWASEHRVQPGKVAMRDYDFESPGTDLTVSSAQSRSHQHAALERYEFSPGKYKQSGLGQSRAAWRLHEFQSRHAWYVGATNAMNAASGSLFTLKEHPRSDQNGEYLLTETRLRIDAGPYGAGDAGQEVYDCEFAALPRAQQYRPETATPRPMAGGPQTAVVVGPQGEDIWTDQYGRVKVQFYWDRDGQRNENSSCWVRVAQPWAGKGWGAVFIPRIGNEVIVDFLGGDPDQPIITGCVYNADQTVPYTLPDNRTQSGIKTRSSLNGTAENYNEIRFEDKKNEEEICIHAEKDMNVVVENNATLKIGFDKQDAGDQTVDIYNHRTVTLEEGNDTLHLKKGKRETTLDQGNDMLQLKQGKRDVILDVGNHTLSIKQGNQETKIDAGSSKLEAMQSIELKVGGNSIKIDQQGITIKGMMVTVQGDSKADLKSPMTTVSGDGILTVKGGLVKIN
ncbi:type VI secretion system Vgr family protein [Methylococcus sp. EFPC2]|uniref:type VI secretion system Vgr family protein n=1 Tax=Methylococcus sp. EFPC2 TaxID=2812648 RepID=UPI001967A6B6|nr:type VI secretion system tip protein VgrG [Methylococcus sp. EFPC2]QSA96395.1 type VI secretion system tip protein VgrG [Methylococcus sp. EFPC2]